MSNTMTERVCDCCGSALNEAGRCLNVDCRRAAEFATKAAGRETRKATAVMAGPRSFTSSGRVD